MLICAFVGLIGKNEVYILFFAQNINFESTTIHCANMSMQYTCTAILTGVKIDSFQ